MAERKHSPEERTLASWYAPGLSDGLGDRLLMFDNSNAPSLELLRFRRDFAQVPEFQEALRETVHRLDRFRHPGFATVRSVQRLEPDGDLALISNYTPGKRLSEVLHRTRGPAFAAELIRQLAPALALLQQHGEGVSHGVLSPDRIVVSPDGRLTIVEHVIGPAIGALKLPAAKLASFGIVLPPGSNGAAARLDVATDWYQLGLVAISVLVGRSVTGNELPRLEAVLDGLGRSPALDGAELSPFIHEWLERALQISGARIESGEDARAAVDELLQKTRPRQSRRPGPVGDDQATTRVVQQTPPPDLKVGGTAAAHDAGRDPDRGADLTDAGPIDAGPDLKPGATSNEDDEPGPVTTAAFPLEPVPVPLPAPVPLPLPVPLPSPEPPPVEARTPADAPAPGPVVRPTRGEEPSRWWKKRAPGSRKATTPARNTYAATRATRQDRRPANPLGLRDARVPVRPDLRDEERPGVSRSVVAALLLVAVVEAGVIAWLAHARWFSPRPAIAVATASSGENVLVSSRAAAAPLRLAVAPDLSWVRVTSPSPAGITGASAGERPSGAIRISSPIRLRVLEGARLLGSAPGADLRIPAGRHDIELVNPASGYRLKQSLQVEGGETVSLHVAQPHGWMTVYAVPTAEVTIDDQPVGPTPIGPLAVAPGAHFVTFRHASGARDRQRVTVKSGESVRVIGNVRR